VLDFSTKKIFLFDLDGTLFNTLPDLSFAINKMLVALGLEPFPREIIKTFIGNGSRNLVRRSLGNSEHLLDEAHALFMEYYKNRCIEETIPYPGVIELLKRNFRAAVLTNKPIEPTKKILAHFGLANRFEYVLGGDTSPERKPSPAGIEFILSNTKLEKQDALMIGDDTPDLLAARAAGIDSLMILGGFGKPENILPYFPKYTVEHFGDLLNLFP
jgi:phosphoglycolate phosphatase